MSGTAWIEIDCDSIARNVRAIQDRIGSHAKIMAVLKSDAYGMGSVGIAKAVGAAGAAYIGVGNLQEAVNLEKSGVDLPLFLMHPPFEEEIPQIVKRGYIQSIPDFRIAKLLSTEGMRQGKNIEAHLNVNVGMNRLGMKPGQVLENIQELQSLPALKLSGIFAHFSSVDEGNEKVTDEEFQQFQILLNELEKRGIVFRLRHIANSAAVLGFPKSSLDLVRVGILLYGIPSSILPHEVSGLKQAVSMKTKVLHVLHLEKGETVSYHRTWKAPASGFVATFPAGYADGIPKSLSNQANVLIRGIRRPVAGLVCMDLTVAYLGEAKVEVGDEVVLLGKQGEEEVTVLDWARWGGLDPHEILTGLGKKLPKIYLRSNNQEKDKKSISLEVI